MNTPTTPYQKVMIIDDNPVDLYITSMLMKKKLFAQEVLQYPAATQALQYLTAHAGSPDQIPQVILVDIYMPEMSGFEFMEAYEQLPAETKKHSKVYIVSSSIDSRDIGRANDDKNVIAFQEKPITREFLDTIANKA